MGIHLRLGGDEWGIIFTWDSFGPCTPAVVFSHGIILMSAIIFLVSIYSDVMQPLVISILLRISSSRPLCASIRQLEPSYVCETFHQLNGVAQDRY